MAATFPQFSDLPKELRLMIWEEALLGARDNRTVFLNRDRIWPMKHLISPLLSVNTESRVCAQAFYHVQLDVYSWCDIDSLCDSLRYSLCDLLRDVMGHEYDRLHRREDVTDQEAQALGDSAQKRGKLYLIPEQDTLVYGSVGRGWGSALFGDGFNPHNFIFTKLPASAREKVRSLIRIYPPERRNLSSTDMCGIMESGGQLPYKPERWVWYQGLHRNGEKLLVHEAYLAELQREELLQAQNAEG
ncbi:hypothetical protein VPNG_00887 [Cytospora leucostoma]|uniref:2EXR domain-containing protein n=1 Tax=Cytospora leucostoma TaxID=1230097 RepID=A0A423XMQ0_9PEZI|nr:hypothetical protein VPNG_00887 [Cytospora leucostoma]